MSKYERAKITISCNICGERFTLRGRRSSEGRVETGFKQCLCDNDQHFHIEESDE